MPTPVWPVDLPGRAPNPTDQPMPNVVRTATDAGPGKSRRRYTARSRRAQIPVRFTGAEKVIFDTFFQDTLADGSLPFEWEDPVTHQTVEMRFVGEPPRFDKVLGAPDPDDSLWDTVLDLEILP